MAGGGAERILNTILHEFQNEFIITLVLVENTIDYELPDNINIVYLNNKRVNNSGWFKFFSIGLLSYKLSSICNERNADFSFSLTTRPNLINSLSQVFGNKSMSIIYEVATPSVQYSSNTIVSRIMKKMIQYIYPLGDLLITNSLGVAKDLKDNFFIKKEIKTIYSPIDSKYVIKLANEKFYFDCNKFYFKFITIGRLDAGKNHSMMIKSFSKIKNKSSILYILGEGELRGELEKLVLDLKMKERIIFLGFDNNPFKYLKQCDVFLFSTNFEGFPTVLVEALACGLPIVSTDCLSGPREILSKVNDFKQLVSNIELSDFGILTPVNNQVLFTQAIDEIINNEELRKRYNDRALDRANYFSKDYSINQLKNIFLEKRG